MQWGACPVQGDPYTFALLSVRDKLRSYMAVGVPRSRPPTITLEIPHLPLRGEDLQKILALARQFIRGDTGKTTK